MVAHLQASAFWGLLTVYELGYLPLRNVLTLRGLATLLARWRELVGYVPAFLSPGRSLERIIESKTPRESGADSAAVPVFPSPYVGRDRVGGR